MIQVVTNKNSQYNFVKEIIIIKNKYFISKNFIFVLFPLYFSYAVALGSSSSSSSSFSSFSLSFFSLFVFILKIFSSLFFLSLSSVISFVKIIFAFFFSSSTLFRALNLSDILFISHKYNKERKFMKK